MKTYLIDIGEGFCIILAFLVCCASIVNVTRSLDQQNEEKQKLYHLYCNDFAQFLYYIITLAGLYGANSGIKINN